MGQRQYVCVGEGEKPTYEFFIVLMDEIFMNSPEHNICPDTQYILQIGPTSQNFTSDFNNVQVQYWQHPTQTSVLK